ncbi:permease [Halostreptopolyspora alba]|uniref:Permease n=1 Tax=Halostreptopolyspora alba TaxID=2487137 RepID=A0A3N0EBG2_9ACTN|nr:permease [Nocardiopsaceae bacterium YIM 96095]
MSGQPAGSPSSARPSLGDSLVSDFDDRDDDLPPPEWGRPRGQRRTATVWVFAVFIALMAFAHSWYTDDLTNEAFLAWATIFTAICLQAMPFLVFGVALSAALTAFVPESAYQRFIPKRAGTAVPVAGAAGGVLPGCECASVPMAGGLIRRGVAPAAALTFLLSAPAINPVVLVATGVAFSGQLEMVAARFLASFGAAVVTGWVWARFGKTDWLRMKQQHHDPAAPGWVVFRDSMLHDLMHAGGYLVVGAAAAGTLNVVVPREWVVTVADLPVISALVMAALAILLSICSEADAFVAASLSDFSPTAMLAFMVVGPMLDLKLIAIQAGTFGWRFVCRFAPLILATTLVFTFLIGGLLL